ncbi:MAG: hypothetical protein R6V33_10955 [Pelovirga sp.]
MNIELLGSLLLWSSVINLGILAVWFALFSLARNWMYKLHSRWFRLSDEQFDALHYGAMAFYKIGILLLNLVPYIAVRLSSG